MEGYEYGLQEFKSPDGVKVRTMQPRIQRNNDANVGIAVRTIKEFYRQRQKIKDEIRDRFLFYVSFFQIYNESVYDLLNFDTDQFETTTAGGRRYLSK
jgi:Kinesin motor domain